MPADSPAPPIRGPLRLRIALAGLLVVCGALVVVAATRPGGGDRALGRSIGSGVAGDRPPAEIHIAAPTLPVLPNPEPLPADPNAPTPQVVLGTVEIPRLGITADLQEGVTLTAINRGPGWWPGTAMPGGWGNVVVAGHRTTYTKPFNRLNELEAGDRVVFTTASGRFVYAVRGVIIVPSEWIDIAAQSRAHTATLFACNPPGSAVERIVAKLELLGPDGQPVDPDSSLPSLDGEAQHTDHTLVVRDHAGDAAPTGGAAAIDPFGTTAG